jgi:acrylyl-CoA reductase (NADPH)
MAIGTAGFTAMLSVMALEAHGLKPGDGEVLVTGAAGGVGSVATALLARLGYQAVASTGRADTHEYLKSLGATTIIDRAPFADPAKRPLETERWAACIDSVGGNTLARVLAQTKYGGAVTAVGLAGGARLEHTVMPFILRNVALLGVDSVMCPAPRRAAAWRRLGTDLPLDRLETMTVAARLADVPQLAAEIVKGGVRGRVVVDVNA